MTEMQAGDGWRLLAAGEELQHGDELLTSEGWMAIPSMFIGERVNDLSTFRRRIPAKPEKLLLHGDVDDLSAIVDNFGGVSIRQCEDWITIEGESIRQFSQWLQQVADWREAQDATK